MRSAKWSRSAEAAPCWGILTRPLVPLIFALGLLVLDRTDAFGMRPRHYDLSSMLSTLAAAKSTRGAVAPGALAITLSASGVTGGRWLLGFALILVVSVGIAALGLLPRMRGLVDGLGEACRAVPATCWGLAIATLPLKEVTARDALFAAVVISIAPVLALSMSAEARVLAAEPAILIARRNGVSRWALFVAVYLPAWLLRSAVPLKTAAVLAFVIVVVLEGVLEGGSLESGLGSLMRQAMSSQHWGYLLIQTYLISLLATLGLTISSVLELGSRSLQRYRFSERG